MWGQLRMERNRGIWLLLLVGLVSLLLPASLLLADGEAVVRLKPSQLRLALGEESTVQIHVEGAQGLWAVQFQLAFDPAVVTVVDADPVIEGVQVGLGDFLHPDVVARNQVDLMGGTILCAYTQRHPTPPVDGSGVLATITFRGLAQGKSPLAFTDLKLVSPQGHQLPVQVEEGRIIVGRPGFPTWGLIGIGAGVALLSLAIIWWLLLRGK